MTSIFVAKIDFGFDGDQLRKLFEQYGKVIKATIATDRETGKSRGFGFVEMEDRAEALNAITALDNFSVNGRPIAVKEAEDRNAAPKPAFEKKPFVQRESDAPNNFIDNDLSPSIDTLKIEPRKKLNQTKDRKTPDTDSKSKKPKMDAYKKSGKPGKFFDDDDEDFDDELLSYKRKDEDDFDDEEED